MHAEQSTVCRPQVHKPSNCEAQFSLANQRRNPIESNSLRTSRVRVSRVLAADADRSPTRAQCVRTSQLHLCFITMVSRLGDKKNLYLFGSIVAAGVAYYAYKGR